MNKISADRLKKHVNKLAGEIGEHNVFHPQGLFAAEQYIIGEWQAQGYEVMPQTYEVEGVPCSNLEITLEGKNKNDIILVGAHYDSVYGCPGANDNGSGVAAMLELSRLFIESQTDTTLRFVAFVNEEPPFFLTNKMGSMRYAKQAKQRGDKIRFMISLETIGCYKNQQGTQEYPPFLKYFYPNTGNFIAFVSNLLSRRVMLQSFMAFKTASDFPVEKLAAPIFVRGVGLSDQLSFWRYGYKAFMITDTAFCRYPYYHTDQDTPDKLDYEPFAEMTNGLYRMLLQLTGK